MPSVLPTAKTSVGSCSLMKHIDDAAYNLDESVGEIGNEDNWMESSKSHTLFHLDCQHVSWTDTHAQVHNDQHSKKKRKEKKRRNKRKGVVAIGGGHKDVENRMDDGKIVDMW